MTVHVPRLPFTLDPVIAAAKKRARQRRFLVAVAIVVVASVGIGAALIASSSSDVSSLRAALAPSVLAAPNNNREGGRRGPFSMVIGFTNGARKPVTLDRVSAVLTARSSLRQFATDFRLYKGPVCAATPALTAVPAPEHCFSFPDFTPPRNGAGQPAPLRVAPGHEALVQLSFKFAGCMKRAMLESVAIRKITAAYRLPDGTRVNQHLGLPLPVPESTTYGRSSISAFPARPGQPASRRLHTVAWVTTRPCQR